MTHRQRFAAMLTVLVLLVGGKVAQELIRFYTSRDQRIEIARLEAVIEDAGLGIIETQLWSDSVRLEILEIDAELRSSRPQIDRAERLLLGGLASLAERRSFGELFEHYNARVDERNALYHAWRESVDLNSTHVQRYNAVVDSIRTVATSIGEPYYPILTPAEIVARQQDGS